MKNLKAKKPGYIWKTVVIPVLLCVGMLTILLLGIYRFNAMSIEQDRQLTYSAIRKASIQCFADEGRFPSDIDYLVENYNVHIDYSKFRIGYDCPAANVSPNISVSAR